MLLTDKYADKTNNVHIFDFADFSWSFTKQAHQSVRRIADENGIEISISVFPCRNFAVLRPQSFINGLTKTILFKI